jgi:hypothetical protein
VDEKSQIQVLFPDTSDPPVASRPARVASALAEVSHQRLVEVTRDLDLVAQMLEIVRTDA